MDKKVLSGLYSFKYSNYLPPCKKSEKTDEPFSEKCQTDGRADGQTDNGDFIGPSVGRRSNMHDKNVRKTILRRIFLEAHTIQTVPKHLVFQFQSVNV